MATPTLTMSDEQRLTELGQDIVAASCLKGQFVLPSGAISSYHFDTSMLTTRPAILRRVARALAAMVPPEVDRLAGAEPGAVPLVTAVSLELGLPCLFVHRQAHGYDAAARFEGEIYPGERVVMIADVLASGAETIVSARALRDFGTDVVEILGVIDREEGAAANIAAAGFRFRSLFTTTSLGL